MLSKRWGMLRWVTNLIKENQESQDEERERKEKEAAKELLEFEILKRFEKIKLLKMKLKKERDKEKEKKTKTEEKVTWTNWREEKRKDNEKSTENVEQESTIENEKATINYKLEMKPSTITNIKVGRWGKGVHKRQGPWGWLCPHLLSPHPHNLS